MLYKQNGAERLSDELFKTPTSEYRGTPFWAWNSQLTASELERQIDIFKQMGLGGFHMHVRTGLENQYLSDEFMQLVKTCTEKAKKEKMLAWLYDEDRWPSGAAGGFVTKEEKYRGRYLLFTPFRQAEAYSSGDSCSEGGRSGKGKLLACYDVVLDENGYLKDYRKIDVNDAAEGVKWYAFLELLEPSSWYNNQTYADTLNKEAIDRFVEVTHERYKQYLNDDFEKTVPAIFTDEPQFTRKKLLNNSFDKMDVQMPWTDSLPDSYKKAYSQDIFATLPELFWDLPDGKISQARYRYHDHIAEMFAHSFADTVGGWCKNNGIALTGHMMEEPTLRSQTAALGEAMRSYRSFTLPGIDMLCDSHEFTTAKQAQSAVHQYGYEGALSELYGVTGWDFDFRGHKHQGDWQAALGITVRVPHLSWYAMKGEAKRDYPASIHYQSPWYGEYSYVEDHFARVNTALTRGKPVVKVAVVHPVESFWLHWGPNDKSGLMREGMDENFINLTRWLLEGSIDFDFICESLLQSLCKDGANPLRVGEMEYDTVIVPSCETLRSTTYERLEKFRELGGRLIFAGNAPTLENALVSSRGSALSEKSENISLDRASLLSSLEGSRILAVRKSDGRLADNFITQLRQDNDCMWLFLAHSKKCKNKDITARDDLQIILNGTYSPVVYDTVSGSITPVGASYDNGKTIIKSTLYAYDSLLLKLTEGKSELEYTPAAMPAVSHTAPEKVDYSLTEKNVLLIDCAQYKLDNESEFLPEEEILRLDNICRRKLGFKERGGHVAQPWVLEDEISIHTITLRYEFDSNIDYSGAELALEDAEKADIILNGVKCTAAPEGYYTDISILKRILPNIIKGKNVLEVTLPFGERTGTENMFILGDFAVELCGRTATLDKLPEKLSFGNLTSMGFPFYGGAIKYSLKLPAVDGKINLAVSDYRGALMNVYCDGDNVGKIAYPPYILTINNLAEGEHNVDILLYLHRYNTFGPLHLVDVTESWHGPGAWRTGGEDWSYEYVLRPTGILKAPVYGE